MVFGFFKKKKSDGFNATNQKPSDEDLLRIWAGIKDQVEHLKKPCLRFSNSPKPSPHWFFGNPKVDQPNFEWPMHQGRPLMLVAQFDLTELKRLASFIGLPETGHLLFFFDHLDFDSYYATPDDNQEFYRVLYVPEAIHPIPRHPDYPEEEYYDHCFVEPIISDAYPHPYDTDFTKLQIHEHQHDACWQAAFEHIQNTEINHQLCGHPVPVQAKDPARDIAYCFLKTQGMDQISDTDLDQEAPHWLLLLEVEESDPGYCWGDAGVLRYWIRDNHLSQADFSQCMAGVISC